MKRELLMVYVGSLMLSGCSLMSQDEQTDVMTNEQLQRSLEQQQQEWEDMKPQLQRILALESDLKLLVEALDTVPESSESLTEELAPEAGSASEDNGSGPQIKPSSELANINQADMNEGGADQADSAATKVTPPDAGQAQFYEEPPAPTDNTAAKQSDNYYGVQLAAYKSHAQAVQGWQTMTRNYAQEFADIAPLIYTTKISGTTYHKLIVGPFVKKPFAANFCNMLKQMQEDCMVTRYQGEPFSSL